MATYQNDVDMDLLNYLADILPYSEENIRQKIREFSFAEFLEMAVAYDESDDETIHSLFASLREADNAYVSSSPTTMPNTTSNVTPKSNTTAAGAVDDEEEEVGDIIDKLKKKVTTGSVKQKVQSALTKLGSVKSGYEENVDPNLQRLKDLSGVEETASGGATGAGAVASCPRTMGKVRRRNQSIYKDQK